MHPSLALCFSLSLLLASSVIADTSTDTADAGVLDVPLPADNPALVISDPQPTVIDEGTPEQINEALRTELESEQEELEQLPRPSLEERAENGERAAQVTLAEDFAKEAAVLGFAPEAANDALSDAVRWYSLAAKHGFPGAPSLDQAGVNRYPIRVQRSR